MDKTVVQNGLVADSEGSIYFHGQHGQDGRPFMWSFAPMTDGTPAYFLWTKSQDGIEDAVKTLESSNCLIMHNVKHDYKAALAMGLQLDMDKVFCTMVAFKTIYPLAMSAALKGTDVSSYIGEEPRGVEILDSWFEEQSAPLRRSVMALLAELRKINGEKWPTIKDIDAKKFDAERFLVDPRVSQHGSIAAHLRTALEQYLRPRDYRLVPPDIIEPYATEDAERTKKLCEKLVADCPNDVWPVVENESRCAAVLAEMEWRGVRIDDVWCRHQLGPLGNRVAKARQEVFDLAGYEFDIASAPQLANLLYDKMGYKIPQYTAKGQPATDGYCLAIIDTPLTHAISEYRISDKTYDYVRNQFLANAVLSGDDYILHPSFQQTTAVTRRLSCMEPNLQNVMRNETTKKHDLPNVRRAFIPRRGCKILAFDYSQMELRALAHYSEEPALIKVFMEDGDAHDDLCFDMFALLRPPDTATAADRRNFKIHRLIAKTMQFGTVYGMGKSGFIRNLTEQLHAMLPDFTTAMVPSYEEAGEYLENYFARRPKVAYFRDQVGQVMLRRGWVKDVFGQRYYLRDRSKAYVAINYLIQGCCATLVKHVMVQLYRRLYAISPEIRMLLQVHDELFIESPTEFAEEVVAVTLETMAMFNHLFLVPMKAEASWFAPEYEGEPDSWSGIKKLRRAA